jgi:hypothetical protein
MRCKKQENIKVYVRRIGNFEFHNILGNSGVAERLAASKEGLYCMELACEHELLRS